MDEGGTAPNHSADTAAILRRRLGPAALGIVLGSGFGPLADLPGTGPRVEVKDLPGWPQGSAPGHPGRVSSAEVAGRTVWFVHGRLHLYEGFRPEQVAFPVEVLAAAGVEGVLLTTAAGGLLDSDRPGDFAVLEDHINLTGEDPLRNIAPGRRDPAFLDLHDAYDPAWRRSWLQVAGEHGARLRTGTLAAVRGPSYETPAEVRMMRILGADLASMSTVPETIASRYRGMRVAALACISNPGAGTAGASAIEHGRVLETVEKAVNRSSGWMMSGIAAMLDS